MKKGFLFVVLCLSSLMAFAQPATPTVSGTTTICTGGNTTLTANGQAGASFKWYDAATGGTLLATTAVYSLPQQNTAGSYHFYVDQTLNSLTSTRKDVTVTVNQTPTVLISPAGTTVCKNTNALLTASGAATYAWSGGPATAAYTVAPAATTTYSVTGTSSLGCASAVTPVTITVYKTVASAPVAICYGGSTTLSATGADTYSWSPGGATTGSSTVSPTATTLYTVLGTGNAGSGCTSSDTVRVTVRPAIGTFAGATQTVTEGSIVTLTAGSATAVTYNWIPLQGNTFFWEGASVMAVPTVTTTYTVTGTDAFGCTATAQTVVTVNKQVEVTGTTTVCPGGITTLTATGTGPFVWYNTAAGGTALSTGAGFTTPAITANTSYWVAGSNGVRKEVRISLPASNTAYALPAAICAGDTTRLLGKQLGLIKWYDAPAGGNLIGSAAAIPGLAVTPSVTTTYWGESSATPITTEFNQQNSVQTWTVPAGINSVQVSAYGSKGDNTTKSYNSKGGGVDATLNVTPGQVLYFFVGGTNNWNGGGTIGSGVYFGGGSKGGDATDIRIGGTDLVNRVLVAGGGGGTGKGGYGGLNSNIGNGGGLIAQEGGAANTIYGNTMQGLGGTQTGGGAGGYEPATQANSYYGGVGGDGLFGPGGYSNSRGGGGGGGGWYGGGGSRTFGDGGGGSSYTNPVYCSNVTHQQGVRNDVGLLSITYSAICGSTAARVPVVVTVSTPPTVAVTAASLCLGNTLTTALSPNTVQLQWRAADTVVNTITPSWTATPTTIAGTTAGNALNQLSAPHRAFVATNGDLYIPDGNNHRVVKWVAGATSGTVVAGGNGAGSSATQLNNPQGVYVDGTGTLYIADKGNHRIQTWVAGATTGTTLFGITGSGGTAANLLYDPVAITRDDTGSFYITEASAHRVSRWVAGASTGTTVAGTAGSMGNSLLQLAMPSGAAVDKTGAVYVADLGNNRIVKWAAGAAAATLAAGGNGAGSSANQIAPTDVVLDAFGNMLIADGIQARIQRWALGATAGATVAGGGSALSSVAGVSLDGSGNLYATDEGSNRVQKFSKVVLASPSFVPVTAGYYRAVATSAAGCKTTSNTTIITNTPIAKLSAADSVCVGGAARVFTITGSNAIAPYTFSYTINGGAVQTATTDSPKKVRYVRVKQNNSNANLNLAEIQAIDAFTGTNVALNRPATASSTLAGYPLTNINDGNLTNFWHNTSGSNTEYVEIDLGTPGYTLSGIKVTNRGDCCQDRSANLQLILKDTAGNVISSGQIDAYQGQNSGLTTTFPATSTVNTVYQSTVATAMPSNTTYKMVRVAVAGCTSTVSDSTRIKVSSYAHFVTQPLTPLTFCTGNLLALTGKATNATGYQWQKDGANIAGSTDTLYSKTITLTDAGNYRLLAINTSGCNDTSVSSAITINESPNAAVFGASNLCRGGLIPSVYLAPDGGVAPYTLQYSLNGGASVSIQAQPQKVRYVRVETNLSQRMGITEIQAFETGTYNNVSQTKPVTSSVSSSSYPNTNVNDGDDYSTSWKSVTPNGALQFIEIDLQSAYFLDNVRITTSAYYGGAPSSVSNLKVFYKDSIGIVMNRQDVNANNSSLYGGSYTDVSFPVLPVAAIQVPTNIAGIQTYKLVTVSSANGCTVQKSDSIKSTIYNRAVLTTQPVALSSSCENVPLTLSGVSTTAFSFKWLKNGNPLPGDTTATLLRPAVSRTDSGIYRLVAVGEAGCNDTSTAAVVQTKLSPTATITGNNQLCAGATAAVVLAATAAPKPYTFSYSLNGRTQTALSDNIPKVRYVRVMQNAADYINLAEIQAIDSATGTNVALNKTAAVSSVGNGTAVSSINDGSTATNNYWHSASSNAGEWVEIDLGIPGYNLSSVKITNRGDCCQNRAANLQLILKDTAGNLISSRQIDAYQGQNSGFTATIAVDGSLNTTTLSVATTAPGDFSYKLLSVTSANGCSSNAVMDSVAVTVFEKSKILTQPLSALKVCTPNPLLLSTAATGTVYYRWQRNGLNLPSVFGSEYLKSGATTANAGTYRVIAINPDGCNDTSKNSIVTVSSMSTTTIASSSVTDTQMHTDGLDYVYVNNNCEPIAEVVDAAGGNSLGMVKAQVIKDASVQTFNLAPYLQRHYDVQPQRNGAATIKLYTTQAEFDAYNAYITANNLLNKKLPTGPTDTAGIANISVLQFHGLPTAGNTGPGGQYNINDKQNIYNSSIATSWNGNYWTLSFPVSGFSGFFINSDGNNVPLPLRLTAVSARNLGSTNEVLWTTATEDPATVFEVERSLDASQFSRIGTVQGTGKNNTSYRLVDAAPATGTNYYRIRAISAGGESLLSKVVTASVKAGAFVVEAFPNPTRDFITVRLSGVAGPDATISVSDVSGKLLWQSPMKGASQEVSLSELAGGLYFLRYQDGGHGQVLKITKE